MPDQKPMVVYAATYGSVSAAETDLDAIEALHKNKVIGSFDAAIIDQENGKPHVASGWIARASGSSPSGSAAAPYRARNSTSWPSNSPLARRG